ncbi:MAG TPA: bifunctional glycosyltransferase/class I SAM-dependent methyltransferase [Pyrinomonadaceae bacterium]|nr:bifunctional glycosyltransferase/class I SAM-dependent methyltransferase [Pyrinomonadaceae bacterium]
MNEYAKQLLGNPLLETLPAHEAIMPTSFRLSVLVPVYNERHVVAASLRRLLDLQHELIDSLEVIVVDDCSTDGSWEILQELAAGNRRITLLRHESNQGKGAAIRTGISQATGDITLIHDADLEYNPSDIPSLLVPFAKEGADAVFGSRYLSAPYRRALMYRHTLINNGLTVFGNWLTDLFLTDIETCYKAINTELLKSIPLRSDDFRFEVEIVSKLAKRRARVFEVPIRYMARSQEEGKKIRARDGIWAVLALLRFWLIDDIYKQDEYGSHILSELERARRFNLWMGDVLRPYVGDRVLEIGAGIGTLTNQFIPRELYVASDINPHYLHYLRSYSFGKPYLRVLKIDAGEACDFSGLEQKFDTALMINVLEHVPDEKLALRNLWQSLEPGGRAVILVPQHPSLYGTLDEALEHRERYTEPRLKEALVSGGFRVEEVFDFNRVSVPGWWFNGKILRRKRFSRLQLKIVNNSIPILRRLERMWPWGGLSLIGIGVKD